MSKSTIYLGSSKVGRTLSAMPKVPYSRLSVEVPRILFHKAAPDSFLFLKPYRWRVLSKSILPRKRSPKPRAHLLEVEILPVISGRIFFQDDRPPAPRPRYDPISRLSFYSTRPKRDRTKLGRALSRERGERRKKNAAEKAIIKELRDKEIAYQVKIRDEYKARVAKLSAKDRSGPTESRD